MQGPIPTMLDTIPTMLGTIPTMLGPIPTMLGTTPTNTCCIRAKLLAMDGSHGPWPVVHHTSLRKEPPQCASHRTTGGQITGFDPERAPAAGTVRIHPKNNAQAQPPSPASSPPNAALRGAPVAPLVMGALSVPCTGKTAEPILNT